MGTLTYGSSGTDLEIDDRLLAHLQAVIIAKLRRDEKFGFSGLFGDERFTAIWLHPSIPLVFRFDSDTRIPLNRSWIEALMISANSGGGLTAVAEPSATSGPAAGARSL